MLNWIWALFLLGAVATAAVNDARGGFLCEKLDAAGLAAAKLEGPRTCMELVAGEALVGAKSGIDVVIGLLGPMILFLGIVRIASDAGLLRGVVRIVRPILVRLFPDVPESHPALGAMVMNLSANVLGLGNAATPLGLRAMVELNRLNPFPGVATNAMALFLAINATSVTLMIPSGVIAIRAQLLGGSDPMAGSIWIATLIATTCSTAAAVAVSLGLQRVPFFAARPLGHEASVPAPPSDLPDVMLPEAPKASGSRSVIGSVLIGAVVLAVAAAAIAQAIQAARADDFGAFGKRLGTTWPLPLLLFSMVAYGLRARVRVYEAAVEGGKEALQVALRIAPYLVTLLAAIAMFRASGALDSLIGLIDPLTARLGVPGEVLPLMLIKPLSGSGAIAVLRDTLASAGPISYAGFLASAVNGSTETTFYVLTLYLGVIGVKDSRYILPACLLGDVAGYAGAVIATRLLYSGPV